MKFVLVLAASGVMFFLRFLAALCQEMGRGSFHSVVKISGERLSKTGGEQRKSGGRLIAVDPEVLGRRWQSESAKRLTG